MSSGTRTDVRGIPASLTSTVSSRSPCGFFCTSFEHDERGAPVGWRQRPGRGELSRQPHPVHKILESRLGSHLVEPRVRENPSMHRAFRKTLFEPLQCLVPLTETFVNYGDKFGWNVPVFREPEHFVEHLL